MSSSYNFEGGTYDPVEGTNVLPEMEADYARIERSENEFFDSLRENDRNRANEADSKLKALSGLSSKINDYLKVKNKQYRQDEEAKGTLLAMTKGAAPDLLAQFNNDEEALRKNDLSHEEFASKYESNTGDYITGDEFRQLSGYAQFAFAKRYVTEQSKDWANYKYAEREKVFVDIDRNDDGTTEKVYFKDARNQAEEDAIDAKIKFEFLKRFNGMNPVLLAKYGKEEIDKIDEFDRRQANTKRQEAILKARKEDEQAEIETNFATANPAIGSKYALDWVEKHAYQYGGLPGARLAFKGHIIEAVKSGRIGYGDALNIIHHQFDGRDGSKKDMTSWSQWRDLDGELDDAHKVFLRVDEERKDTELKSIVETLKEGDDYTQEQKANIRKNLKDKYGYVPEEVNNVLADYEDDDQADERIKQILGHQNNMLFDYQLVNVSPLIKRKYSSYIKEGGVLELGNELSDEINQDIRIYTNEIAETSFGSTDAKTLRWRNLNIHLEAKFRTAYVQAIKAGHPPEVAYKSGLQTLEAVKKDPKPQYFERDLSLTSEDEYRRSNTVNAVSQSADGGWHKSRLASDTKSEQDLVEWTKGSMKISDIPSYYRELAERIGVNPLLLAKAQARQVGLDIEDDPSDEQVASNNEIIKRLLFYKTTPSRILRGKLLDVEENGEPFNAKNSPYNKKNATMPGV